jgi:ATPase family associated with various cellular activities (AAA)
MMKTNPPPSLAIAHLLLRLRPLNRALRRAVENQRLAAAQLSRPDLSALCLTDEHVKILLDQVELGQVNLEQVDRSQSGRISPACSSPLSSEERTAEDKLRADAANIDSFLPLDQIARNLGLTDFEQEALLLCVAPELDRTYERIYSFILDDLNRRFPCLELLIGLTTSSVEERLVRRHILNSLGRLRRTGILSPFGSSPTELRQEFQLGPEVFEYLTGSGVDLSCLCRDPGEIAIPEKPESPIQVDSRQFERLVKALATGSVSAVGIWGPRQNGIPDLVVALAASLRRGLRRFSVLDLEQPGTDPMQILRQQVRTASGLGSVLWLETDGVGDPGRDRLQRLLADMVAKCPVPLVLTGACPWRPEELLRSDGYTELELTEPVLHQREQVWSQNFPELESHEIEDLASRFGLGSGDIFSVSKLARTRARLAGNGQPDSVKNHVDAACSVVMRRSTSHFTSVITPRRGPDDLVLRADLHGQVVEVAKFFRLRQRVDQDWGFGRLAQGGGMKALFTGEPGTGKTLAAEVIAGLLGVSLYKVDLSRVVSKWVGETEKNLESAFREAEESHSVLLFDEAEALFGSRSEVQHGTDRYANLEVSYLLQRLESSTGLIVLASNVKDLIDSAFIRRFQVVVHFPKPGNPERRRIWEIAFPKSAPVSPDVNLDALANLDMTGAAIVSTARSAALLAADAGSSTVSMADVVRATARQFRREARVLTPSDLGSYKTLLQGVS